MQHAIIVDVTATGLGGGWGMGNSPSVAPGPNYIHIYIVDNTLKKSARARVFLISWIYLYSSI